ncbi:hypothetical protein ERJ75_001540700 [Trypanosoma vivax]|nr:hypothetical protein ERJ75_001540700 [Trypanosoma vivax]
MARRKGFERNTSEGRNTAPKSRGGFEATNAQDWGFGNRRRAQPECRLLGIAGSVNAGDGGLLLTTGGDDGAAQNTVHLGTFVKITALHGGSASFDKTRDMGRG